MNLEKLLSLVPEEISYNPNLNNKEIRLELQQLGISQEKQTLLLQSIAKIRSITSNVKTQTSLFRSYFRIINEDINKDGRGSSIIVEIIKKCGKNCTHCYSKFINKTAQMSDKTLNIIVTYARKNYKHIFLTGGEPTLDPRVFTLAEQNPDIIFFMFTNGSLITPTYAQRLSKYGNLIPLIGIDGNSPVTHDTVRGKGSYTEVMDAITNLNEWNVSWGFISLVTEKNATEILSQKFLQRMIQKGAIITRFLEYIPVGPKPLTDCILSGETYYFLEKRKNEIRRSGLIYMQDIAEKKCNGLLFFSVHGDIKNCYCFHYSKYNIGDGDLKEHIERTKKDWISYNWKGECPIYSDPVGFKNHLLTHGWKNIANIKEPYLNDEDLAKKMQHNYTKFLKIKTEKGV